ncbi:NAD-dependent epimerase/dehydratase family protein [Candidatus Pseudothioglobus singularis]|jgi:UDP-sulfoquinovose synthase|nr:NAD-dependent epimerase/dehydratase family protein [Candidatus Pseudothioglobus singularis]
MRIIIFGGDGFCGWPTSLYLSKMGHEVIIVDNLSRRKIDLELECNSLTPIQSIGKRVSKWNELTKNNIKFINFDVAKNYSQLLNLFHSFKPDSIIHFAEQRSAPYSMKGSKGKRYTIDNNLNATNNLLSAIVESKQDVHVVHLGSMGVYGYSSVGLKIPEGYINVKVKDYNNKDIETEIPYPPRPGSIYHLTKTQDSLMFAFYNENDGIRVTDLHQGIVWGTQTNETSIHDDLINRFDYDGDYGTVLNRFLMQAAIGHPLTVHGTGGQTRAFIHIKDMVKCIEIALLNPPKKNDKVLVFNQMTETHNINDLANKISNLMGVSISYLKNPRNEANANDLIVENECFLNLGLNPITLDNGLLSEVRNIAKKYCNNCDESKILSQSFWTEANKPKKN